MCANIRKAKTLFCYFVFSILTAVIDVRKQKKCSNDGENEI